MIFWSYAKESTPIRGLKRVPRRVKDLVGHKTGFLQVVSFSHSKDWKAYWNCECRCGRQKTLPTSALTGPKSNRSCGKCGLTRRLPDEDRVRAHLLLQYKNGAKERELTWDLSDDQAWALMMESCHWCGTRPIKRVFWKTDRKNRTIEFAINGIDRLDSSKGYETSNCVASCGRCNRAKGGLSVCEFLEHVAKIVRYQELGDRPPN